jgi:hypothetical protein
MSMAAGDLTTLDNVKAWLGLPSAPGDSDTLLSQLITTASNLVTSYLDRDLIPTTYSEVYDGTGAAWMMLRQSPITAVASISFCGRTLTTPGDPVAGTSGFFFDGRRLSLIGDEFPFREPVAVAYTAGYATIPAAIGQAVNELVGEAFKRRDHIGQSSKTLGGQETVAFSTADMNAAIKTMLAPFRAVAPV